ncbi:cupin-like domain-containing protein [Chitinimonas sp. BJYL2]|uniref:cupin-like domain-containing protein n=1 Tax=Chitinimonas sp. BJYL2 TaxID=2976696 RepID=UPI0022B46312|nr:cupin-like domain-containing protein [Chitinimonas sp. BJYL2]
MHAVAPGQLPPEVLDSTTPVVLRGLVAHWPLVQAAQRSAVAAADVLRAHWQGATVGIWVAPPEVGGRFFYTPDFSGFNFVREYAPFDRVLDTLLARVDQPDAGAVYMGSTTVDTCLPGLLDTHPLHLGVEDPLVSLWLGNRTRIATHQDWPDNLACVASGRRRFTLFPPDAVGDLYIGPVEHTPAGQPVSLVDVNQPDFDRFPRYRQALARAITVELAAGDALFIPSLWWHHVEALDTFSALINYWWRRTPAWADSPVSALWLAMATVRDLPAHEREAWRAQFNHYVFDANAETAAHVPDAAKGLLGRFNESAMRRVRALLLKKLNR